MSKLVLIDGHSILNRAFYGVPDLSTASGLHTNAVYGFLNILFKLIEEENPDYLAVAFDVKAPTFRHLMYKEYKGTRKGMPEELREQVPVMKEMLKAMGILIMEKEGLEADDILGTLAKRAEKEGVEVSLVSGDRDLLQIATEKIKIRIPKTKGGQTKIEDYYHDDVVQAYQVTPAQFIELKALMGDTADNIPGVPKIGEKTATSLMVTYGSIDSIYEHLEEISKKSVRETLRENRDLAELSKELATIKIDSDIGVELSDAVFRCPFTAEAYHLCQELEFKHLLKRFSLEEDQEQKQDKPKYLWITDKTKVQEVFLLAKENNSLGIHLFFDENTNEYLGISLCFSKENVYLILKDTADKAEIREYLNETASHTMLSGFHLKKQYDVCPGENVFDCMIAAYLCNPLKNDYLIEDIAREYLSLTIPDRSTLLGKNSLSAGLNSDPEKTLEYLGNFSYISYLAKEKMEEKLNEFNMWTLFNEIEMPLSSVLYRMERTGVRVKRDALKEYGDNLTKKITVLEKQIYEHAGEEFNINSPKQLGEILFGKLNLPGGKKTKTGYSTAADVLEKLAPDYPMVKDLLEYRTLSKLKSTYADGLAICISEDGKIHTTFNQTITATGRISSTEPNLQNIPMRMELGRLIRKVFVPEEGYIFMDADYSQIELRLLAHLSEDERLIEAYKTDADIHRITASQVFHIPMEEVTDLQRRNAKAVNFGIVYGISSFGLSQDLSITRKEAGEYIEKYFSTYPGVKAYLDRLVEEGKENGFVATLYGRRRPIPELKSSNFMQRSFGERVAMNSPIQGTAADIMKIAMINVDRRLRTENLESKMLLQVHDELLLEVKKEEQDRVSKILDEEMKGAANLLVSLEIDVHTGNNWYEAK